METKHTPGPWIAEPEEASEGLGIAICAPESDEILATITPEDDRQADEKDWANARLIAAVPDLLAACKFALAAITEGDNVVKKAATRVLAAAINKAIRKES